MADSNTTTSSDEFWSGIWWVSDGDGGLRSATPGECAAEIKRLRAIVDNIIPEFERQLAKFEGNNHAE